MKLSGKVAVVTGAASGIGLALSRRFLAEGASVVMVDIEVEALTLAAALVASAEVAEGDASVATHVADVSDAEAMVDLRTDVLRRFGAVHVLCNNAGVASGGASWRTPPKVWDWVVGVDLLGVAYGVSTFVPLMVEQGEGHVVNTASEAGLCATPMLGAYHAAKYGVVGLSEALVMELAGTGVGVSCLCPELVATRIFESTRNAPAHLGFPQPDHIPMERIEAMLRSRAMDPMLVADAVVDAIEDDRFWVLTHEVTKARIAHRAEHLSSGATPTMPKVRGDQ